MLCFMRDQMLFHLSKFESGRCIMFGRAPVGLIPIRIQTRRFTGDQDFSLSPNLLTGHQMVQWLQIFIGISTIWASVSLTCLWARSPWRGALPHSPRRVFTPDSSSTPSKRREKRPAQRVLEYSNQQSEQHLPYSSYHFYKRRPSLNVTLSKKLPCDKSWHVDEK